MARKPSIQVYVQCAQNLQVLTFAALSVKSIDGFEDAISERVVVRSQDWGQRGVVAVQCEGR